MKSTLRPPHCVVGSCTSFHLLVWYHALKFGHEVGAVVDVDVGVVYRMDSRFYLRAGPEFTWGPGAGLLDFSLAFGFGYLWSI